MEREPYCLSLEELKKAYPHNHPNPCVGAVIYKEGELIGRGYTQEYPGFHAEVNAIESVRDKKRLNGATLYVTLMPCCHFGKTPPCTDKIIESGIKKVVVALRDPNPLVFNKSEEILRSKGIEVEMSYPIDIAKHCFNYNETFFARFLKEGSPFVSLKYAMTLDGKIADYLGDSKWISSETARDRVHQLRARHDGVLVGEGTVLKDNPKLTVRGYGNIRQPTRVILNCGEEIDRDKEIFSKEAKSIFLVRGSFSKDYLSFIEEKGHRYFPIETEGRRMSLHEALSSLKSDFGITSLLVEGGAKVMGSFFNEMIFDKMSVFIANKVLGDGIHGLSPILTKGEMKMKDSMDLQEMTVEIIGENNVLMEGYRSRESYFFSKISR